MKGINKKQYIKKILQPWTWIKGAEVDALRNEIAELYNAKPEQVFLTGNGRTAQYLFFKSLGLTGKDNVVIQGYTCNAAVGPIFWSDAQIRYVDINPNNYSLSLEPLKKVVNKNTKVVIVQHTYGIPGPTDEVMTWAKEKGIYVFEDTAHALGLKDYGGRILGTKADASLISFGIDKVLNTRVGGALLVNNPDLLESAKDVYKDVKVMGVWDTKMWLLNPFMWFVLARFKGMRKKIARFLTKVGVLNMGFYQCEFRPEMPRQYPRKLSNALAWFVRTELKKLDANLQHRKEVVDLYTKLFESEFSGKDVGVEWKKWGRSLVKFPILMPDRESRNRLHDELLKRGYLVSMWYDPIIFPDRDNKGLGYVGYKEGLCPNAEAVSERILALPTGMNVNDVASSLSLASES